MTDYNPDLCNQLIIHCENGGSIESFCAKNNIIFEVFNSWKRKYQEFQDCVSLSLLKEYAFWESHLIRIINEGVAIAPLCTLVTKKNDYLISEIRKIGFRENNISPNGDGYEDIINDGVGSLDEI